MLQWIDPTLKAIEEIEERNRTVPLSPEGAYQLTLRATGDKQLALQTKVTMALNAMPTPDPSKMPTS